MEGLAVAAVAAAAAVGRYAMVKKRSCCAVRMWGSCCSFPTCKATAAAAVVVAAVEMEQCQVWEAAVASDGVRIMWLSGAGSWPSPRPASKGCCCVEHFVTTQVGMTSGVGVAFSVAEVEVQATLKGVGVEAALEVVSDSIHHPRSLDSNVSSTSNTFPRPPVTNI